VFANGGYLIQPYFIHKIVDDRGNALALAEPRRASDEALRVLDPRNAFIMDNMMQDVTRYGTAARAARLARADLAGKTGTTNEFVDAWFAGYQPGLAAVLGRLRPAQDPRPEPDRRRGRAADLARLHGTGACRIPGDIAQRA
jgi:membrane carboxypeptidase/penicillin-binding protein